MTIDIETIRAGIQLAGAIRGYVARTPAKADHSLGDKLSKTLRVLYFPPDGILAFLKAVERSEEITPERLQTALPNFNDREWMVASALTALDFSRLQKELKLNIATIALLERLRTGKLDLRHDIQEEINYYGQRGVRPDRERVRELISAIEQLNSAIEEVERLVNTRAKA